MDATEFALVGDMVRAFVTEFHSDAADTGSARPAAARESLVKLGLTGLRGSTPPAATSQECALLAEEHGRLPMTTSFVGPLLLAPELLRLLGADAGSSPRTTIALARDLRFPGSASSGLIAWDCDGADSALRISSDGTVSAVPLGSPIPTADLTRSVRTVPSDSPAEVIGRLDPSQHKQWQSFALVMVSSELLGATRALLQRSVDYARYRRQYGRAIGSYQAVQHLLADATVLVEACTSAVRYAAWSLDHHQAAEALKAARVAKAEANTSLPEAIRAAMQVFGGVAQTWEHSAHLYLRKILVGSVTLATTADLLAALAGPDDAA
ncbi:acyl-CoA dehydrogenase family protein [Catenulispora rubra]|uniref:acyl-CoA dehydrogenase family protein n=1 Tax=Catenulispora rubra TaxID=280293 RepID=UPI001892331A|nr:acyl-CoA dehydrogenase family protein [Catenulispora rubra]